MEDNKNQFKYINSKICDFKETLTEKIKECNAVYIASHRDPDFDAISSMGAMGLICKRLKKSPYLVINEEDYKKLPTKESEMFDRIKDKFVLINMDDYYNNKLENSLLIVVDVNKGFRTPFKNDYDDFSNIIIIDHHETDEDTIKTKDKLILDKKVSSCSEIMYWLLKKYRITPSTFDYYKFLLVGIYLDTDKKNKDMYPSTYSCMKELFEKLDDDAKNEVEAYFSREWDLDMKLNRLKSKTDWKTLRYAIAIDNDDVYTAPEVSMVADDLLKYVCEASIVCGKQEDGSYHVSARSNRGNVDIAHLMHLLGNGKGGGHMGSAACDIYVDADTKEEEKNILYDKILKLIYHQEHDIPRKKYYIKGRKLK